MAIRNVGKRRSVDWVGGGSPNGEGVRIGINLPEIESYSFRPKPYSPGKLGQELSEMRPNLTNDC